MTELATRPAPVRGRERIEALDVLRGVAVLGILVMNIQAFAMPFAAYSNPSVWTDGGPVDLALWAFAYVFAEQKFMAIFSLLFGVGVALMLERLEARRRRVEEAAQATQAAQTAETAQTAPTAQTAENTAEAAAPAAKPVRPARIHYRRTFGLLLIGLAHAYLLWYGDILVTYALCGFALYPLRRVRPKRLLAAGIVVLLVAPLLGQTWDLYLRTLPVEEREAVTAMMVPGEEAIQAEVDAYRSGWLAQMPLRARTSLAFQTVFLLFYVVWRAGGLMLIGMALYKWGVVSAERSPRFYRRLLGWGFGLGFPLVLLGMALNLSRDFAFAAVWLTSSVLNYLGSVGVALGYLALIMLWCLRPAPPGWWRRHLAAVGRMALTHYLLQTILCVLVFYGYGLGLFGHVDRAGQWLVVLAVWTLQLLVSPWWLERYRFGPFEWLWRTMTYGRAQPFRRAAA